jgi:hypothetical protein
LFSGSILELELESSEYFTRIVYSSKIETKSDLILEKAILVTITGIVFRAWKAR